MELKITSQMPSIADISHVIEDTKNFPYLVYVSPRAWRSFSGYYTAYLDGSFAGVLAVNRFGKWTKLGPFAVLAKFHGKGVAMALVEKAIATEKGSIYLASANPKLWKIVQKLGFIESYSWKHLPVPILICYLKISLIGALDTATYIKEMLKKQKLAHFQTYRHFVYKTTHS